MAKVSIVPSGRRAPSSSSTEAAHGATGRGRATAMLLEGDAAEGEAGAHIRAQRLTVLPALVGRDDIVVRRERFEEVLADQDVDAGHPLALQVVLDVTQRRHGRLLPTSKALVVRSDVPREGLRVMPNSSYRL